VEGLRITDEATLEVVVGVLAGTVNTRFVAALVSAGVQAVASAAPTRRVDGRTSRRRTGRSTGARSIWDRVGIPSATADVGVLSTLLAGGFVPVVASVGIGPDGPAAQRQRRYVRRAPRRTPACGPARHSRVRRRASWATTGRRSDARTSPAIERLVAGGTATAA